MEPQAEERARYADGATPEAWSVKVLALPAPKRSSITPLCLALGQNRRYFACGTATGVEIFHCEPFQPEAPWELEKPKNVILIDVLDHLSWSCAFVSREAPNRIDFYTLSGRESYSVTCSCPVRALKLRVGMLVVVLDTSIHIFKAQVLMGDRCNGFNPWYELQTSCNSSCLCDVNQDFVDRNDFEAMPALLACPALEQGHLQLVELKDRTWKTRQVFRAHTSQLACLAFSQDASLVATASVKGTLIRIFNTAAGACIRKLRRGLFTAQISCIAFSKAASKLAISSDAGQVQVLGLASGSSSFLEELFSFGSSFYTGERKPSVVGFSGSDRLVIAGLSGSFFNCTVNETGEIVSNAFVSFKQGRLT